MKFYLLLSIFILTFIGCKKQSEENCFSQENTTRIIIDKNASIIFANSKYYIVEKGTIDTRLLPCSLSNEYKINGLQVIISGDVKNTVLTDVCCTENFVITKIIK